jgi:RNA polymerase sigma factor (sigma-70 family)
MIEKLGQQDFERLFEEHAQPLFGFLIYRTGNRNLAEDLLADTFERALRGRRRFDPRRGSEKNWLYAIALNLLRDHRRRREAEERALGRIDGGPPAEDRILETLADRDLMQGALATLSGEEREAIALRYGGDLTLPEMAKLTGEPLTTVKGRVYRALHKLREELTSRPETERTPTYASGR